MTDAPDGLLEQTYFADPALDRAFGVVFRLMAEVQVLRDKVQVMEQLLEQNGALKAGETGRFTPNPAQAQALAEDRKAFVQYVLTPVLGRQAARGEQS